MLCTNYITINIFLCKHRGFLIHISLATNIRKCFKYLTANYWELQNTKNGSIAQSHLNTS